LLQLQQAVHEVSSHVRTLRFAIPLDRVMQRSVLVMFLAPLVALATMSANGATAQDHAIAISTRGAAACDVRDYGAVPDNKTMCTR
jgi:hypothetical protein